MSTSREPQERCRKHIFCEIKFLKEFLYTSDKDSFSMSKLHEAELICGIKSLIKNKLSVLHLDVSKEAFEMLVGDIRCKDKEGIPANSFEHLITDIDLAQQQSLQIKCNPEFKICDFEKFITNDETQLSISSIIFSMCSEEISQKIGEKYGTMVICPDNIEYLSFLSVDNGSSVEQGTKNDWKNILSCNRATLPSNAMIIVDNYLLNNVEKMTQNLTPILDALLPNSLSDGIKYEICFVSALKDYGQGIDPIPRLEKINEIIKRIKPELDVDISIFKCGSFHDRYIITNNLYISSGGGLDLYNNRGKSEKDTTINLLCPYLSIANNWSIQVVSNLLRKLTHLKNRPITEVPDYSGDCNSGTYIIGTRNCRLLTRL